MLAKSTFLFRCLAKPLKFNKYKIVLCYIIVCCQKLQF